MAPNPPVAVDDGHKPRFSPFLLLMALMAALLVGREITRVHPTDITRHPQDPQERGAHYEDHVLANGRLLREVRREGSTLRYHPRLFVPLVEVPAQYYAMPQGHRGVAVRDEILHEVSPPTWPSVGKGGFRIPDALETRPDGTEVLYELKCPSPWLRFDSGSAWAQGMQAAFASQALAYFVWMKADKKKRKILYGYCGWVPRWSKAILEDFERQFQVRIEIQENYLASDFPPAERLRGKTARDLMTAVTITVLNDLAPGQVADAVFDRRKD